MTTCGHKPGNGWCEHCSENLLCDQAFFYGITEYREKAKAGRTEEIPLKPNARLLLDTLHRIGRDEVPVAQVAEEMGKPVQANPPLKGAAELRDWFDGYSNQYNIRYSALVQAKNKVSPSATSIPQSVMEQMKSLKALDETYLGSLATIDVGSDLAPTKELAYQWLINHKRGMEHMIAAANALNDGSMSVYNREMAAFDEDLETSEDYGHQMNVGLENTLKKYN